MHVVEHRPAVVVHERFRRGAFRPNHLVPLEFDVDVLHALDRAGLGDGHAVDQFGGRHQHPVQVHGVQRRDMQIAPRQPCAEGARADADRQDVAPVLDEPPSEGAAADPFDGLGRAVQRDHAVADGQVFDGDVPAVGADGRARAVAGGGGVHLEVVLLPR